MQGDVIYHIKLSGSSVENLAYTSLLLIPAAVEKIKVLFMTHLTLIINKREGGTFLDLVMVVSDISEQFLILNTSKEVKVMASLNEMLQKLNCITIRTHSYVCTYVK